VKGQVEIVVGAAEQLPFREGVFDRATTKSVLIHTDLPAAAREVHRTLREGGRAVVLEPLEGHPAIQAYRAFLAPKAWKAITRYWNPARVKTFAEPFGDPEGARLRFFHLTGVVSAFFTYGPLRCRFLRRFCEAVFDRMDVLLLRVFPGLRWRCWFAGVEVERGSRRRESA
jgi:SAM-dependent methyltransferase